MFAPIGMEIRASASKSSVKHRRTPERSAARSACRAFVRVPAPAPARVPVPVRLPCPCPLPCGRDVARGGSGSAFPFCRGEHDREIGRRVEGEQVEQLGERAADAVDRVDAEAGTPAVLDDLGQPGPHGARVSPRGGQSHDTLRLRGSPQRLARRRLDPQIAPTLESAEQEATRARPLRQVRHRRAFVLDVPQPVGVHGVRGEPRCLCAPPRRRSRSASPLPRRAVVWGRRSSASLSISIVKATSV